MTEAEWLKCEDPRLMLNSLQDRTSAKRLFQFAAFCWRRGSRFLEDEKSLRGVEALESLAKGMSLEDTGLAYTEDGAFLITLKDINCGIGISPEPEFAAAAASSSVEAVAIAEQAEAGDRLALVAAMVGPVNSEFQHAGRGLSILLRSYVPIVREFFGNPFRPIDLRPCWRTSTVFALLRGMCDNDDFSSMPMLGDALEDAGCDDAGILQHCRSGGPHVRGCWVIEMLLGES